MRKFFMKSVILLHRARSIKRRAILFALGTQLCFLPGSAVCAFGQWNARAEFNATELELAASPYASGIGPVSGRVDIHAPIKERLLMGFENNSDGEELMSRQTAHLKLFASSDYGVSQGRQSARVIATQKDSYAEFVFPAAMMKGWEGFDFLALDIHVEQKRRFELHVEFRDARSRDYHSRCTLTQGVRNGSQTLLFPIALLRRNGKEGLDESELRPDDLIPHAALREVKLFFETDNGKLPVFWLDQVRLLNREALSTPMPLDLPAATALAVNFGSRASSQPNFDACFAAGGIHDSLGFKVESSTGIIQGGSAWPDGLCGSFLMASDSGILRFTVPLSNGVYRVLLLAGPVICSAPRHYRYLLKLNDQTLIDDLPDRNRIDGRDYLHRFMWTAYSERRDGLFLDYIERMYPVYKTVLTVHDGTLMIAAKNCFVSALVAIPEANKDDAGRFAAKLRLARARAFEQQTPWPFARAFDAPAVTKDDVALDVFLPRPGHAAHPKMTAQASDRAMGMIRKVLAPGQNLFARFCLRPDTNMGWVELQLSDGVGKRSSIGHAGAKLYFSNYRYAPDGVREGGLLPTDHVYLEPRITQTCHVWWPIPANTSPGV
ncbi:MAG: hypothetical protein O3C57_04385, partial [Verrucomicrobia bacterium]|nr:hypothetical protein [Verrucomicrobiota bacterium]